MTWAAIDGRVLDVAEMQAAVDALPNRIWASGMTLHNTGAPNLTQRPQGFQPQHILNLVSYFRDERGWSSAPHAFIDDQPKPFKLFTPFTSKGTHSPSWNGTKLGIEMLGDYDKDDPYSGRGLKVYNAAVALFAMLHTKYGWDPATIKMHYEDPRTTHACPGKRVLKTRFIEDVQEYMGHGGDLHAPAPPKKTGQVVNVAANDWLNVRDKSSVSGKAIGKLFNGQAVTIVNTVPNGNTKWVYVEKSMDDVKGWVNAAFIKAN